MLNNRIDSTEIIKIADAVADEKSIDKNLVLNSMETAIEKAARTRYGSENEIYVKATQILEVNNFTIDYFKNKILADVRKYTNYSDIKITGSADLIIKDGDEFIPDILGLSTTSLRGRYTYN